MPWFFALLALGECYLSTKWLINVGGVSTDSPNCRSAHTTPTPRGGGLAFFGTSLLTYFIYFGILTFSGQSPDQGTLKVILFASGFGLIGLAEDRYEIPAKKRLLLEFILALFAGASGLRWLSLDFLFGTAELSQPISIFFTAIWIVWVANLYNFMDGINGIAALQGIILMVFIGILMPFVKTDLRLFAIILASSLLGFIPYNFPKAKIFMGDCGSLYLGGLSALLPLNLHIENPKFTLLIGVIFLSPFFLDTLFTLGRRAFRGENLLKAHSDHTYQKLAKLMKSHSKVTLLYSAISIFFCSLMHLELDDNSNENYGLKLALTLIGLCLLSSYWVEKRFNRTIEQ